MRRMLAKPLISTGTFEPFGFSNSSAGPPFFTERSANSVISSFGSTSNGDALQFFVLFEGADEVAQIVVCHVGASRSTMIASSHDQSNRIDYRREPRHWTRVRAGACRRRARRSCWRRGRSKSSKRSRRRFARRAAKHSWSRSIWLRTIPSKKRSRKRAKEFGRIDILVNNAGVTRDGLALRMKRDDWDAVLQTNLSGAFFCIQQVMPADDARALGPDCEYFVGGGRSGQCGAGELRGIEGRA